VHLILSKWRRVLGCFYLTEKVEDLDKASDLELKYPHGAQADRFVWHGDRMSWGKGLEEGHTRLIKAMSGLVAPFRALDA